MGSEGERLQAVQGTDRFDHGRAHRDAASERLHRVLGFCDGQHRRLVSAVSEVVTLMSEPDKDQWFVVHVLSGQEQKVYDNLTRRIKTEEMGDFVYEVLIPTERVSEIKRGKSTETTRKFFPATSS